MDRISALREALLDRKRIQISEIRPVSGRIFPDPAVMGREDLLRWTPGKRSLRDACEKLVGQDRQHPVHQVGHHFPVPPDKDHAASEFVLEPGKDPLHLRPGLVPTRPVGLHRNLLPSPGVLVNDGNKPKPLRERSKGGRIVSGVRQAVSLNLPCRLLQKERSGLAIMKRGRGQKTGDGQPSLHDRDRKLVTLPDLVLSLTVPLGAPRTVPGKGPLHSGRFHRNDPGHSRHLGRRNRLSLLRSSPLPFDLHCHRLPGIAGLFPGGDGRGVKGGMGNPGIFHETIDQGGMGPLGDPVRARTPKTREKADSCGRDLPLRNPRIRRSVASAPRRSISARVEDRFRIALATKARAIGHQSCEGRPVPLRLCRI